jgi:RNA polymerase-binding transcription factor DksA
MPKPVSRARKTKARPRPAPPVLRPPAPRPEKTASPGFPRAQCKVFRELLLKKRHELVDDVEQLEGEAFRKNRQDDSGDLSTMPIHLADLGTDNFEKDVTLGLIETEEEEVREIDAALERIQKGVFGRCEKCDKLIAKTRLRALPYARLCITCKSKEEAD